VARVLIVEDEPEIQALIGDLLLLEGYEVHALGRVPRGLDAIRRLAPDAIVLDLRLPGIGGIELLRLLSADAQLRETPILICSGAADLRELHSEEFRALGCEVVAKPFELDELLDGVRRAVERRATA
jgi:DNA-binding response OmpR family regulator